VKSIFSVADDFGAPERTEEVYDKENDRTFVTLYYDSRGIEVRCVGGGDLTNGRYDLFGHDIRTAAIHILSDRYRFGRANIGLGSTQEAVHTAYLPETPNRSALTDYPPFYENIDEAYRGDDHARIMFCYGASGLVERMVIDPSRFG